MAASSWWILRLWDTAALHLNLRPAFGVFDALQNLHRLDASLLDGLLTQCKGGLQLLAAPSQPFTLSPTAAELARLFDLLVSQFRFVVVDCSNRVDGTARLLGELSNAILLVTQADVVSLWSAGRMRPFLEEGAGHDRVRLIFNRYKKIPGFTDEDVEKATDCNLLWKLAQQLPGNRAGDRQGVPVAFQATRISGVPSAACELPWPRPPPAPKDRLDLVYEHDKADRKGNSPAVLLIPSLRAGQ